MAVVVVVVLLLLRLLLLLLLLGVSSTMPWRSLRVCCINKRENGTQLKGLNISWVRLSLHFEL
jgi:hypothetical protein